MPASHQHRWTRAEVERLIDERKGYTPRYELVDGELLVTPAPSRRHQRVILELAFALRAYTTAQPVGEVVISPCELHLDPMDYYEPDLFVVPSIDGTFPSSERPAEHAILACEVLSPSSSRHDRVTKRRAYQALGVPDYWVVDPDAEAIEIWHPGDDRAALIDDRLIWAPARANAPFVLDVRGFFARVADGAPLA
ncbi:MAG TPA: Uma2 family endonuclease [Gemmatimonadaceae bacterium]|nr:Uma2 family endonuclease [Gemmatimonadaceae bacterium]